MKPFIWHATTFFFLGFMLSPSLQASSYSSIIRSYKKQRFHSCYKKSLKAARRGSEVSRSKAYLMAGICASKLDRDQKMQKMFKRALKLNPKISFPLFVRDKNTKLAFLNLKAIYATNRASKNNQNVFRASEPSVYLPLGFNYFLNDQPISFLVHGGIQALAFAGALDRSYRALKVKKENDSASEAAQKTGTEQSPAYQEYKSSNNDYISKMNEESLIFLTLGLISYGYSIWDVGTNDTRFKTKSISDSKQSRQDNFWQQDVFLSKPSATSNNYALTWYFRLRF